MLRKKFVPPVTVPNRPVHSRSRDQQPLPERDRTLAALPAMGLMVVLLRRYPPDVVRTAQVG